MNDIPTSDLPDCTLPASAVSRLVGGSRIRSQVPIIKASRLPGTYAANFGEDMNWRRGVAVLWTLFGLAAILEVARAVLLLLAGNTAGPLPSDLVRVGVSGMIFVTLWLGWRWTRWVLVVSDFLCGTWLVVWVVALHIMARATPGANTGQNSWGLVVNVPSLGLGLVYVSTAGYLAFSADMVDFARHRREEGRGWVLAPVAGLVIFFAACLFLLPLPYGIWLALQSPQARRFGDEATQKMAQHWNLEWIATEADDELLEAYPPDRRDESSEYTKPLGPLQRVGGSSVQTLPTAVDGRNGGFVMQGSYEAPQAVFAHGHARVRLFLRRHLSGPWKVNNYVVDQVTINADPGAEAASTKATPGE